MSTKDLKRRLGLIPKSRNKAKSRTNYSGWKKALCIALGVPERSSWSELVVAAEAAHTGVEQAARMNDVANTNDLLHDFLTKVFSAFDLTWYGLGTNYDDDLEEIQYLVEDTLEADRFRVKLAQTLKLPEDSDWADLDDMLTRVIQPDRSAHIELEYLRNVVSSIKETLSEEDCHE